MTLSDLRLLLLRTFSAPREVARALIALQLSPEARWLALLVVMVLSALISTAAETLLVALLGGQGSSFLSIVLVAALQGVLILYGAAAMTFFGRRAGGQGTFAEAMVLVTWIEFVLIVAQCVQFVVMLLVPALTMVGAAALVALLFYLLTQFTAALHGFQSLPKVALAVVAVFFGTAMLAGMIFVSLGLVPPEAIPA